MMGWKWSDHNLQSAWSIRNDDKCGSIERETGKEIELIIAIFKN